MRHAASTATAYIGLGSNLDEPRAQIRTALRALAALPDSRVAACSSLYRSRPMGPQAQPDFINAVARLETALTPHDLLDRLQQIELDQRRQRDGERWGPRTLDLDVLLYDNEIITSPRLTVPHYGLRERNFVLYPLQEIVPDLVLPDGSTLTSLLEHCPANGLEKIE